MSWLWGHAHNHSTHTYTLNDICTLLCCSNAFKSIGRLGKKIATTSKWTMHCYIISHSKWARPKLANDTDCNYVHICDSFFFLLRGVVCAAFCSALMLLLLLLLTIKIQLHDKCCVNTSMFNSSPFYIDSNTDEMQQNKLHTDFSFSSSFSLAHSFHLPRRLRTTNRPTVVDTVANCSKVY